MSETFVEEGSITDEGILGAAETLVDTIRDAESRNDMRASCAELFLEVGLTGGGVETWKITIERTASSH